MMTLYGMIDSGNCYKPRLAMAKLGIPFRNVEVSSHDGATRSAAFTAKNPNAMVPLLELEDGRFIAESNAMLLFLAEGTRLLPQDKYARALTYQWLFFEQYSHEPYIAVRRALLTFPNRAKDATPERLAATLERGNKALGVMDKHLAANDFFAGDEFSVADIALYAYTHVADEGGFDVQRYPAVAAWLRRVEQDPGHVPMDWLPA
ncbi:glutathione S-transferase family protein [Oryzicola mucosus]|uniref:Glutathione S-transferase family protein n=1 Tax=Oryzicola mucosus TaxID=2767425 RepID=A0A8J6U1L6_9HYPH|nr:glutathione S-transferase family protein [Oryzicola mucosus]MBD0414598.1 glutathione S-transferase family protein [Oryzicola mucosus]